MNFLEAMSAVNTGAIVERSSWIVQPGCTMMIAKSSIWSSYRGSGGPPADGAEMIATLKQTNDAASIGDQPFQPSVADVLAKDWAVVGATSK